MMRLLPCQGGGCLGIGQAIVAEAIEKRSGKQAWQLADLVGGTSVGAINGACFAAGISAADMMSFYTSWAAKIFSGGYGYWARQTFASAKYDSTELDKALAAVLGQRTLADCKTNFLATGIDMASGRLVFYQSYGKSYEDEEEIVVGPDSGMKLCDVASASARAQTYFQGAEQGARMVWDGGNTGNNAPDWLLCEEAEDFFQEKVGVMLSLGPGKVAWPFKGPDMRNPGIVTVLKATLQVVFSGPECSSIRAARRHVGAGYFRLNAPLPSSYEIDDASVDTQAAEMSAWRQYLADQTAALDAFIAGGVQTSA